jgi:hypothetical protein
MQPYPSEAVNVWCAAAGCGDGALLRSLLSGAAYTPLQQLVGCDASSTGLDKAGRRIDALVASMSSMAEELGSAAGGGGGALGGVATAAGGGGGAAAAGAGGMATAAGGGGAPAAGGGGGCGDSSSAGQDKEASQPNGAVSVATQVRQVE